MHQLAIKVERLRPILQKAAAFVMLAAVQFSMFNFQFSTARAQSVGIGVPPAPVEYTVAPEIPGPDQPVTITVEGVGDFIGNSPITWTLDGKIARQGTGERSFGFTTGPLGHKTTVAVAIQSSQYGIITNTWTFSPSLVNLVWEAQTTVPPLYSGKALYSTGSSAKVFAFPEVMASGKRVPASALSFQWKLNGQAAVDQSGLGQSAFSFAGDELHSSETVSVDVYSGGTAVGHADITIPAVQPGIVLYAHDPLRGILYDNALPGTFTMGGDEVTVHAEPYFFSRASAAGGRLNWSWTLNGNPTSGPNASAGELTLRTQGGGSGNAILGVSLQNTGASTFLQAAQNSITLMFGGGQKSPAFGI